MKNPFPYSDDNKRYHTWNYHLRHTFGEKVMKISLNAGFTCPNIDGTKGTGGCSYCSSSGSGDFAGDPADRLLVQFEEGKKRMRRKWSEGKYMPYFQAHTNTYAPTEKLRECFEPFVRMTDVAGLSIATRADCLSDETVEYLAQLNKRTYLIVELGLQSVFDETGARINRCHTYEDFLEGYRRLSERGIRICVHLINGLPGENKEMMLESARKTALLKPYCVKLHLLHVLKGTRIADELERGEFSLLSREEYVDIIVSQLELFPAETVIQRLTGDGGRDSLIGPLWSLKKFVVLNEIDKEMLRRDTFQGKKAATGAIF